MIIFKVNLVFLLTVFIRDNNSLLQQLNSGWKAMFYWKSTCEFL